MKHKRFHMSLTERRSYAGFLFIIPLILGVIFVFIPNVVQTFQFSLNKIEVTGEGFTLSYKGFQYYKDALFENPNFIPYLVSSLKTLITNIVVILIFSLFISTLLNQKFHGRILARIIFFLPVILSTGVIITLDNAAMSLAADGVNIGISADKSEFLEFNTLLSSLNFNDFLIRVVTSAVSGIYNIVKASGIQIFIFLAALQEIPDSLYEAASVEGCSQWELFWKITFPMIAPQIAVNTVYTIVDACSQDSELFTYIKNIAFNQNQYALSTAMSVLYLLSLGIIILIVFGVLAKFIRHQYQ